MSSFNHVHLMGNITRDPEVKYTQSQTAIAEFGLAMNRKWKTESGEEREDVTFVDCTAFGKTAETIGKHFAKGKPIIVHGRLKLDQWDDKETGAKRSKLKVVVEQFTFVPGGGNRDGGQEQQQRQQLAPAKQDTFGEKQEFKEDDIPF